VTVEKVGMRLKGNSSLRGVSASGTTAPQSLPWLIRFDKYVDGQTYQGHTDIVIRGNSSKTSLNEAVALELIDLAGEATQESIATRFSINGSADVLRLAIELPNDDWDGENFDTDGLLYKAESTGDYSYRGDNPDAYADVFDQESDTDQENLAPLIDFLEFINTSNDATFAADLSKHLDVDAFARYLALQELVNNFDDIDGPGNNSYLRYDESTRKFTVLSWDMNLAFGSSPGGPMGNGGAGEPRAGAPPAGGLAAGGPGPQPPAGGAGAAPRGGPGGRSNILVQRFQANATFAAMVAKAKTDLMAQLFTSGKGAQVVDRWAALLTAQATDLVDATTIDREAAAIRAQVD
jgi:spore coat protein CotH